MCGFSAALEVIMAFTVQLLDSRLWKDVAEAFGTMYEQMEVVDKIWLARGHNSSDFLILTFEMQRHDMSRSASIEDLADKRGMIIVACK